MTRLRLSSTRTTAPAFAGVLALSACVATGLWWAGQIAAPRPAIAPAVQPTPTLADPAPAASMFGTPARAGALVSDPRLASVKVVGVIVHPTRGAALLAVDGAPPKAYSAGDTVATGLTLREVTADYAVFDRLGERITLAAPRRGGAELTQGATATPTPNR